MNQLNSDIQMLLLMPRHGSYIPVKYQQRKTRQYQTDWTGSCEAAHRQKGAATRGYDWWLYPLVN